MAKKATPSRQKLLRTLLAVLVVLALAGTLFDIVKAEPAAAAKHEACINAELPQRVDGALSELVRWNLGDKRGVHAVLR